jgi:hypothetical protein
MVDSYLSSHFMSSSVSVLGPVDPTSIKNDEKEKSAPWIVRKLVEVFLSIHPCKLVSTSSAIDLVDVRKDCHVFL